MKLKFDVDYKLTANTFRSTASQVPYAAALTLTKIAGDARDAITKQLPTAFDRPTDFTLRGVYTRSASKAKLVSEVYFPESVDELGKAKREYIRPGAQGAGQRRQKKTEYLLTRMGALPRGWLTTPGKGASLDSHGNVPGSVYKQITNVLQIRVQSKPVSQRSQKGAKRLGVAALFFLVAPGANTMSKGGGWLPPGVWKHLPGGKITQILKFVKKASYQPRIDVRQVAMRALVLNLHRRWQESADTITKRFSRSGRR